MDSNKVLFFEHHAAAQSLKSARTRLASTYTGVGISGTHGVFAKIDRDGGTGIAFVNIEDSAAMVTMTAYDDSGNKVATETVILAAHQKVVDVPSELFTEDIGTATYLPIHQTEMS